ncbi:MAG: MMPL family transporter [Pseudomonadota bacterium]
MTNQENQGQTEKSKLDFIVDHRWILVSVIAILTVILSVFIPNVEKDPTLKSVLVTTSPSFMEYQEFRNYFDDDEYVVIAVKLNSPVGESGNLAAISKITNHIAKMDHIADVLSLTNLRMYQKRGEQLSNQPAVTDQDGVFRLLEAQQLEKIRKALPILDLLVSPDYKTAGVLVRIDERWKFDHEINKKVLSEVSRVVTENVPAGATFRIVGQAELRQAILRYTLKTALIFGILCTLICIAVTGYVFRSLTVTTVTMGILGLCVLWVLGIMAVLEIPLNATTSLSFGLILITTLEMVIHMVTRYNQFRETIPDRILAVKQALAYLFRPFFIASATTAVGFGSCMITSIPMVFQLGLIMSLGVTISFCLAMILIPTIIISLKSMDVQVEDSTGKGGSSRILEFVMNSIRRRHTLYTVVGFVLIAVLFSGAPLIRSDPQILHQLGESSIEVKDIRFVEQNLASIHSIQLMIQLRDGDFKKPEAWKKVQELENQLLEIPQVVATDSLLSLLEYVRSLTRKSSDAGTEDLFENPKILPQILFLTSFTTEGKRLVRKHLDNNWARLNITVRVNNESSVPLMQTVKRVESIAKGVMGEDVPITVTGELVVVGAQGEDLINSEIKSMFVAVVIITILMMIQMGTPLFGVISLIPNVPPVAAVFGIMGYFGIPLDGVTVFAATVAVGLAVDNTIQFVAQLKREIRLNPGLDVEECLFKAYSLAAKPMTSWSIVTLLGFLAMLATPFQAAVSFGILVSSAIAMGIFGDLIFMQSMILTFSGIRKIISRVAQKENIRSGGLENPL